MGQARPEHTKPSQTSRNVFLACSTLWLFMLSTRPLCAMRSAVFFCVVCVGVSHFTSPETTSRGRA
eukprot:7204405-Lingulodinium_polyedra.AAC.1